MKFISLEKFPALAVLVLSLAGHTALPAQGLEDADAYYEDALAHYRNKDFATAIVQLKNALQLDDNHLPAKILLGESLLGSGEPEAAEAQLNRARRQGADENLVAIPIANSLLIQFKYRDLEHFVNRGRRSPAVDSKLQVILGIAYVQQQDIAGARRAFSLARQLDPDNPEPLLAQASIALNNDELDKVETLLEELKPLSPNSTDLWLLEGDLLHRQNRGDEALAVYDRILRQNPEYVTAILRRSRIMLDRGSFGAVINDLKPLWEDGLYDPEAIYLYSMALARNGDTGLATEVLEKASSKLDYLGAEVVGRNPTLALLSATIAYQRGNTVKAMEDAERLIDKIPSHTPTRMLLARIHMDLEEYEEVVRTLEPVLHRNETNPQFLTLYGQALVRLERYSRAIQMLQSAMALSQSPEKLLSEIALAKMANNDEESAVEDLERAFRNGRYDTRAAVLLAYSRLSSGNVAGADAIAQVLSEQDAENPVVHNLLGTLAASKGDSHAARMHFQDAVLADGSYTPALMNLVKFDLQEGLWANAESRLGQVLKEEPGSREAMAGMAKLSELNGRLEDAAEWLEKLRLKHPDALSEIIQLINIYLRLGKGEKALTTAEQLREKHNRDFSVLMTLLNTQLSQGNNRDVIETINRSLRYTVDFSINQLLELARLQVRVEDIQGARSTLSRCLFLDPGFLPAKTELVKLETRARNHERAIMLSDEIIAAQPDAALGYSLKADVLISAGQKDQALKIIEETNKKWPGTELHLKIVRQRMKSDRTISVLAPLEKWAAQNPDDMEAQFGLAVAYIEVEAYDKATRLHEFLLRKLPNDASIHNNLAWLYQRDGDGRALDHAKTAYELSPNDPDILDTFGWVLAENGQLETGLSYIRKALSRSSHNQAARYHLALILSRLDRRTEAMETLENLLQEESDFREVDKARALAARLKKSTR